MLKCLSLPDLLDELSETNVVGVELVDAEDGAGGGEAEEPAGSVAEGTELAFVDVVVNTGGEAHVGVGDEGDAEDTVDDGLLGQFARSSQQQLDQLTWAVGETTAAETARGISEAAMKRSKAQWYEPWAGLPISGNAVASLTVPLRMACCQLRPARERAHHCRGCT